MSVATFGTDSTYYSYPITPSTSPRGFSSHALLASRQEPVSPPRRCQVSQTKNQLLTPRSSLGSLSEVKSKSNIESETHAGNLQYTVARVLRAVQAPGPNSIVEIRNATSAVYDALMHALDAVKGISLHYDALSSKIIVYGPASIIHNATAFGMISLAETASEELYRISNISNVPDFECNRLIQLLADETVERVPDSSFSIRMEDEGSSDAHTVVIEVAYSRSYAATLQSLRALLHIVPEVRLGILIKIRRPGKPNWRKATEWKELKDWQVWMQLFTTPEILKECYPGRTPDFPFEDLFDDSLPPDVVMDASQQSEHVAPSSAPSSAPSPAPPSPESSTASEVPVPENLLLAPLGSYRLHPPASNASSIPICFGTVLDEATANKLGVPWETVRTELFNWDPKKLQRKIKRAIMDQILHYEKWLSHFKEAEEASEEDELDTLGGKRKRAILDPPAKRPRLDIAASLEDIESSNPAYKSYLDKRLL